MPVGMDSAVVVATLGAHMSTGSIRLPEALSLRENLLHRTVEDWFMYGVSKIFFYLSKALEISFIDEALYEGLARRTVIAALVEGIHWVSDLEKWAAICCQDVTTFRSFYSAVIPVHGGILGVSCSSTETACHW
jgi:hypothetical protein